ESPAARTPEGKVIPFPARRDESLETAPSPKESVSEKSPASVDAGWGDAAEHPAAEQSAAVEKSPVAPALPTSTPALGVPALALDKTALVTAGGADKAELPLVLAPPDLGIPAEPLASPGTGEVDDRYWDQEFFSRGQTEEGQAGPDSAPLSSGSLDSRA